MQSKPLIMVGLAIVFGALGVVSAQRWVKGQTKAQPVAAAQQPAPLNTIVVAGTRLRYGMELNDKNLREVSWPSDTLPPGAFKKMSDLLSGNGRRVVLSAIEPNEPVLQAKVTGPGQRATLSALIDEGMGAVTVHVNEVLGIAGFVLPGDHVDLLLTRQRGGEGGTGSAYTDVVLRNVRVLAVGQTADDRAEKPSLVSAVTLEVDPVAAQKIAVASTAGTLSLMLRRAGETVSDPSRRVSLAEIGAGGKANPDQKVVRVTRAMERHEYSVPTANKTPDAASAVPARGASQVAVAE
jgi:pilus assembly protein CpaB